MNYETIITVAVIAAFVITLAIAIKVPKFRHVFRVPEGSAGLLYPPRLVRSPQ